LFVAVVIAFEPGLGVRGYEAIVRQRLSSDIDLSNGIPAES
jgi:hypothetical protein